MNTKAELIVLNHTKFGENAIILHTLSNEYGRRGFLVRAGAKSSMALFLPMNILEAEISENPKSQLWRASNFVCLSPLNGIRGDIRKNTMTVFMSEVLYRAILEDTNEGGLASWLKQEILTLDALKSDFSNFHLLFLLDLCSALGFSPSLPGLAPFAGTQLSNIEALLRNYYRTFQELPSRDGNSQSASLQDGLPQSSPFQDRLSQSSSFQDGLSQPSSYQDRLSQPFSFQDRLSQSSSYQDRLSQPSSYQDRLSQSSFSQDDSQGSSVGLAKALLQPLRGTDRNEIAEAIIRYISYHTETNLNIRSLAILREIFG
ncbi:MAG: recombination protein O N-terminal domain-containing protein [Bacteroidales bacterium]|nr:recombination protein O N-terminal domain-containing protein [Bacteroidales bacterium]MDY2936528.1 recombination protein O N-terminal domain-containing protein [Candidatus Cryptobacteroides sp.]